MRGVGIVLGVILFTGVIIAIAFRPDSWHLKRTQASPAALQIASTPDSTPRLTDEDIRKQNDIALARLHAAQRPKDENNMTQATHDTSPSTSTSPSPSPEATPADLSRVLPFSNVPTLLDKPRAAWIKTLGTPTESVTLSQETLRRDNLRSLDSWHHGSVDMIVTWNKARLPVYISFATTKGSPVLSLEEVKALAAYFGLSVMYTPPGVMPFIHFWGSDNDPIKAQAGGSEYGLNLTINGR